HVARAIRGPRSHRDLAAPRGPRDRPPGQEGGATSAARRAWAARAIRSLSARGGRSAVANDGGDIVFHGFRDGVVFLHMRGACSGCPSSTATLRHGIENLLKHFCPDVEEVRPV